MPEPEPDASTATTATTQTLPESPAAELRVALFRVTRRLKQQRATADITEGQHAVLTTLCKHGAMTPGALADHERVKPPSMTRTVNALVERGFVRKSGNPDDGRQVVVELTEEGNREIVETRRRRDAWLAVQLDELTPAQRETLHQAAEILLEVAAR
ncbi:MarR family winged helix-turn-helix transcriptional regulator [Luteimicrobium album]|uniref:MarR family winged helix-turn-helix transcriptional regulator n=1 Tax=Luteimicrobium album TaxID=1054550 RepID=UPI0024E164BA|nr:MarR family transcriptional regulator [Luteimicrobium album]